VDRVFRQQIATQWVTNLLEHSAKCCFAMSACTEVERQVYGAPQGKSAF
jgi:hypothetical protein